MTIEIIKRVAFPSEQAITSKNSIDAALSACEMGDGFALPHDGKPEAIIGRVRRIAAARDLSVSAHAGDITVLFRVSGHLKRKPRPAVAMPALAARAG